MKTLPAIAAVSIAVALLLVPLATAAAGSITFTSPASGASYKGSASYTISGTVSPAPTQADGVGITVKNPAGQIVDQDTAAVTNGAFSYSTAVGGTSSWTTGTYTISATDSFGATGSTTFTYTSSGGGTTYNVTAALIKIQKQLNETLAQNAILQKDLKGNETAEQTTLASITNSLNSITSSLSALTSNLNSVSQAVTGLQTSVTNIGTQVGNINTVVQGLGSQVSNAASQATTAANNASSVQTYVLVVAVLAAITLVLELAILVRKLS